jgi:hypothetical protein
LQKEWCLFYFNVEEKTLATVPRSWVKTFQKTLSSGDVETYSKCWWPREGSKEETASTMRMLVRNCSEPDYDSWQQHRGANLGVFHDFEKCQTELEKREGQTTTDTEANKNTTAKHGATPSTTTPSITSEERSPSVVVDPAVIVVTSPAEQVAVTSPQLNSASTGV